jgi:hypothetical protein
MPSKTLEVIFVASTATLSFTPMVSAQNTGQLVSSPKPEISPSTKEQINQWVSRVRVVKPNLQPSDDPDYSEFWIELVPKDPDDQRLTSPMSLSSPLSGALLPNSLPAKQPIGGLQGPVNVSAYVKRKMVDTKVPFADFSEDAWGEIGPKFAEIAGPEDGPSTKIRKNHLNAVMTIRAMDHGKAVPKEYYKDILNNLQSAGGRQNIETQSGH